MDGSVPYGDENRFREMTPREFVRRFRRGVAHDENSYVWLIGAGCSASSGVPTAAAVVRRWLKELIYLETGQEHDIDAWASKRFFGYDPNDPASIYGDVLQALFHLDQDRRRELDRLTAHAQPGFGYATLAQLMTHAKWGERTRLALSVNFDDMLADALHVYSQRRPQVVAQEALSAATPLSSESPSVLKLHGDAHLPADDARGNHPQFREPVRERVQELLGEAGLVIVGYGGRERCILDLLEGLPPGAPPGGVFWINDAPPQGAFGEWLERANAIWVRQSDFDELMYFVRVEFGLGHPQIERFENVFRKYNAQYRELLTRAGMRLDSTPDQEGGAVEPQAIPGPRAAPAGGGVSSTPEAEADPELGGATGVRRVSEQSRRERLRQSFNLYTRAMKEAEEQAPPVPERRPGFRRDAASNVSELLDAAVIELHGNRSRDDRAEDRGDRVRDAGRSTPVANEPPDRMASGVDRMRKEVLAELVPGNGDGAAPDDQGSRRSPDPQSADSLAPTSTERSGAEDGVESVLRRLDDADDLRIPDAGSTAAAPAPPSDRLSALGKRLSARRGGGAPKILEPGVSEGDAAPPTPTRRLPVSQASFADARFQALLEADPSDALLRVRYAWFLAVGAGDARRAEAVFEAAEQLTPRSPSVLREYAKFALDHLRDPKRAERLLTRALHEDLRNAETLVVMADFLSRGKGDDDGAENCLRFAIETRGDDPRNFIAYGRFLAERRGAPEAAEAQLRLATELRPESTAAYAELAMLTARRAGSVDLAEQLLARAVRVGPDDAVVAFAQGVIAETKGEIDEADAFYRRAVETGEGDLRAQLTYGRFLHRRRGDVAGAEHAFRAAMEIAPHRGAAKSALAALMASAHGDAVAAASLHRQAVTEDAFDADVLMECAVFLGRDAEHVEEADELFRRALALAPRNAGLMRRYGTFLSVMIGDQTAAEAQLRAAVELDPHGAESLESLAEFLHKVKRDAEEAEVFLRQALKIAPNRTETLSRFAAFLRSTKQSPDEAETFYRKALDANPKDAHSLARSAQFLLAKGRSAEGLKVLSDAFDAAWRMDPGVRPSALMLELWVYRYAHDAARRVESLRAAVALIEAGVRCDGWDFRPTVSRAIADGHPNPDILEDLAAVASEGHDPTRLLRRSA